MKLHFSGTSNASRGVRFIQQCIDRNHGHVRVVNEAPYDLLVANHHALIERDGSFYVGGLRLDESHSSAEKILLTTAENIAEVSAARFHTKFTGKFGRFVARLSVMHPISGALVTDLYFVLFSSLVRIYGPCGPRRFYYFLPTFSKFVKDHPNSTVYSIITNKGTYEQENVLHLPAFFRHHLGEWQPFIEIKKKRKFEKKRHFCAFIVSNMHAPSYVNQLRLFFYYQLSKYKKVDCYGAAFHNKNVPQRLYEKHGTKLANLSEWEQANISKSSPNFDNYHPEFGGIDRWKLNAELFRDYKFVICFENSVAPGYITEKLPNVMMGNSIAIYHGAPDVGDYFNPASFINYSDYPDYKSVIRKVIELDQDDAAYARMLRTPFFIDNQVPQTILDKQMELDRFLDRVFAPVEV